MDKLGDDSAAKFINALIKSVQTLCHGYLDFQTGVEIIGHINLSVDKGNSLDYILKEKVSKNAENSTLFISSSFHAEPKPEQDVSGKTPENQTSENSEITDSTESGRVSSAISSISSALTASKERERSRQSSSSKDFSSLHSHRYQNTAKRKASFDENGDFRPAKVSYHDQLSDVTSESSYHQRPSSPIDSKEALRALKTANFGDVSETVLPQTANVRTESCDIGVNLAGSVLEPVEESQNNPDLPEREEDSDNDLEVTFIKEEYVEGEGSLGDFENSGGQQFTRGPHQRASDGNIDPSLFSLGLHPSSASSTYVPSASSQQYSPGVSLASTSQPQPGTSGMRGTPLWNFDGTAPPPTEEPDYSGIRNYIINGKFPKYMKGKPGLKINFKRKVANFAVNDNKLIRLCGPKKIQRLVILDKNERQTILKAAHEGTEDHFKFKASGNHLGQDKTEANVSEKYWWPYIRNDIRRFILSCLFCQKEGAPFNRQTLGLNQTSVEHLFDQSADFTDFRIQSLTSESDAVSGSTLSLPQTNVGHVSCLQALQPVPEGAMPVCGYVHPQDVNKWQMYELEQGSGVYIHRENFEEVMSKKKDDGLDGKAMVRYLLHCFWRQTDLVGASIAEPPRPNFRTLDRGIVKALLAFCSNMSKESLLVLRRALGGKVAQINALYRAGGPVTQNSVI